MKSIAYCSGPLFCPEELSEMQDIAETLENGGFDTFLPQRDGVEAFVMNSVKSRLAGSIVFSPLTRLVNRAVFAVDIFQIVERCDCLVFNMNGRVPDEGGVVETGVAFTLGKPVVIYRSGCAGDKDGFMMAPGWFGMLPVADEITEIPGLLLSEMKHLERERVLQNNGIPPGLKRTVDFGKKVFRFLRYIQFLKPRNKLLPEEGGL